MRLLCNIQPRRNGTVTATGPSGTVYEFSPDEAGDLVADVANMDDAAHLLGLPGDRFEPANEEDFLAAEALLASKKKPDDDDEDGDDDDEGDPNAPPIEAGTPPKPPKAKPPAPGKGTKAKPPAPAAAT